MHKTVILELKGDLEQHGFYVTLQIVRSDGTLDTTLDGYLPPSVKLSSNLEQWQQDYRCLSTPGRAITPEFVRLDGKIHPIEVCIESARQLAHQFREWLRANSFRNVELHLRQALMPTEMVQVLIRTGNADAQALPWHVWDFVEQYPNSEIALSGMRMSGPSHSTTTVSAPRSQLNILAVLGDRQNIDIESDRQTLNQLPGAHVEFLVEPSHQQLSDTLYEQPWDILFFAGHSMTAPDGHGILRLNKTTSLTVEEIKYAVRRAIANGLQLAIFNSCNGLGLAHALAELQLPHMIIMREAIPDPVAQQFLKYFLKAFTQGQSLPLAEREARERLQGMEKEYPCASWLPMLYQQSTVPLLVWSNLQESHYNEHVSSNRASQNEKSPCDESNKQQVQKQSFALIKAIGQIIGVSLLSTVAIMGFRWVGFLQQWELSHYDQLFKMRSMELPDSRILIVGVDEEDLRTYGYPLPDDVLAQLIGALDEHQPRTIGLDIYRDQPVPSQDGHHGYEALVSQFRNGSKLVTPCTFGSAETEAIAPPPHSPLEQIGFVDLEVDVSDFVVRRHLLSHQLSFPSLCNTNYSFTLQLLFRYIDSSDNRFSIEVTPELDWQINDHVHEKSTLFRRLSAQSGGYQTLDAQGNQILINYRKSSNVARQVSVQDILDGTVSFDWIKNKVVLIGVVAPSIQDYHNTPVGRLRGLHVHANILSHYLSAIEENRPVISWLPQWIDLLFVFTWTSINGIILWFFYSWIKSSNRPVRISIHFVGIGASLLLVYLISYLTLTNYGIWLPTIPTILSLVTAGCVFFVLHIFRPIRNHD